MFLLLFVVCYCKMPFTMSVSVSTRKYTFLSFTKASYIDIYILLFLVFALDSFVVLAVTCPSTLQGLNFFLVVPCKHTHRKLPENCS